MCLRSRCIRLLCDKYPSILKGNKNGDAGTNGHFNVPRNIDIQLETAKVSKADICQLRFYAEYQWLVDFALYALLVYTLTEVSYS